MINEYKEKILSFYKEHHRGIKLFLIIFIAGTMVLRGVMQIPGIREGKAKIARLNKQIEYENQRQQEVSALAEKTDTDEYIEKMASERLGLVKNNSKIFIDVSGE